MEISDRAVLWWVLEERKQLMGTEAHVLTLSQQLIGDLDTRIKIIEALEQLPENHPLAIPLLLNLTTTDSTATERAESLSDTLQNTSCQSRFTIQQ